MQRNPSTTNNSYHINFNKSQLSNPITRSHCKMIYDNIDKNFISSIQRTSNANQKYYQKMKSLHMDELDKGLKEYKQCKINTDMEKENQRKDYRERVNSVLGDIQKNIYNRSILFQSQLIKQQEKKKKFIDDNAIKQRKISQHVQKNYDKDVFHHEADKYQEYQENQKNKTLIMREWQLNQGRMKNQQEKLRKRQQIQERLNYQRQLTEKKKFQQQLKLQSQFKYQQDLQKLVDEKKQQNRKKPQPTPQRMRHNPITNPIEYHIQNPYFLKKLQRFK